MFKTRWGNFYKKNINIEGDINVIDIDNNNLNVGGQAFILKNTNIGGNLNIINTYENSVNLEGANIKKYECIWKY